MEILNELKLQSIALWQRAINAKSPSDKKEFLKQYYEILRKYKKQKLWLQAIEA